MWLSRIKEVSPAHPCVVVALRSAEHLAPCCS